MIGEKDENSIFSDDSIETIVSEQINNSEQSIFDENYESFVVENEKLVSNDEGVDEDAAKTEYTVFDSTTDSINEGIVENDVFESVFECESFDSSDYTTENANQDNCESIESVEVSETVEPVSNKLLEEIEDVKNTINAHYEDVKKMLKNTRTKDANVLELSKQLQQHRDGFAKSTFKSIAMELIAFREECRRSVRSIADTTITSDLAIKYGVYLCDDFVNLFEYIGVTIEGEDYFYNGKNINSTCESVEVRDVEIPNDEFEFSPVTDIDSLTVYLKEVENAIIEVLKNNAVLDSLVSDYAKANKSFENGLYQVVLYPAIRRIIDLYNTTKQVVDSDRPTINEDNAKLIYLAELNVIIDGIEDILLVIGVFINREMSELYDPKKQKIVKYIITDKEEDNGVISAYNTECYEMDDKVIYPSRVEVYKFKK